MIDIESDICLCCPGRLYRIREDVAERLDIVPAQFRVLVVRRCNQRMCKLSIIRISPLSSTQALFKDARTSRWLALEKASEVPSL